MGLFASPEQATALKLSGQPIQLNQANTKVKVKSFAKQLAQMKDKIGDIEKLTNDALKNE